ncbi:hypothetical protein A3H75_02720 [Candidatus Uhrbacteria bacterium RIFCSPLOWO2_02_FULL_51_9]|uniref:Segregation and condensation protein A n=1 Tax=Candidatus Uhrbacteria bacterium RIFCSPLOWO2_02_FULL_51_9 TaxID=1802410 RepID=A0A1F7VEP7_9BACT|nr:MAG: hypothetical protein A3H75_02720 [Candidatus Uhrbacteria bacterium RIFCSPLOWO2_02_FULL_51_9]
MIFHAKLEQFQGPLDLLLQLIEKEDLDISKVALASVTEEYLAYVEHLPAQRTAEIADFLVIAARLVYLKSKLLVPDETPEEEGIALEDQLRLYKKFMEAARDVEQRFAGTAVSFIRDVPSAVGEFVPPKGVSGSLLEQVMQRLIGVHTKRREIVERVSNTQTLSIEESFARIYAVLERSKRIAFGALLSKNADIAERVVHFLALLELAKQRKVTLHQRSLFHEIHIAAV